MITLTTLWFSGSPASSSPGLQHIYTAQKPIKVWFSSYKHPITPHGPRNKIKISLLSIPRDFKITSEAIGQFPEPSQQKQPPNKNKIQATCSDVYTWNPTALGGWGRRILSFRPVWAIQTLYFFLKKNNLKSKLTHICFYLIKSITLTTLIDHPAQTNFLDLLYLALCLPFDGNPSSSSVLPPQLWPSELPLFVWGFIPINPKGRLRPSSELRKQSSWNQFRLKIPTEKGTEPKLLPCPARTFP